jgi:hypothetical protein
MAKEKILHEIFTDIILLQLELPCLSFKVEDIYISEPLPNLCLHCLFVFVTEREREREREGSPGGAKVLDSQHSFLKESIGLVCEEGCVCRVYTTRV